MIEKECVNNKFYDSSLVPELLNLSKVVTFFILFSLFKCIMNNLCFLSRKCTRIRLCKSHLESLCWESPMMKAHLLQGRSELSLVVNTKLEVFSLDTIEIELL